MHLPGGGQELNSPVQLTAEQAQRLAAAPVGHLATAGRAGAPHVIPVCFALERGPAGPAIYSVLDQKPKRAADLTRLRRVRNLMSNPRAALVVDHYEPDWSRLWYILVTGAAELLTGTGPAAERAGAIARLREKYPQYRAMDLDANPVIKLTPRRVTSWAAAG